MTMYISDVFMTSIDRYGFERDLAYTLIKECAVATAWCCFCPGVFVTLASYNESHPK